MKPLSGFCWRQCFRGLLVFGFSLYAVGAAAQISRIVPWATPAYTYTLQSDVIYGQGEINGGAAFTDLSLDLYIPDVIPLQSASNQFPLLVLIHGGGFLVGDKADAVNVSYASAYAERGWMVASINYRLQGDDPIPSSRVQALYDAVGGAAANLKSRTFVAAVDDTLTALDFLQARADVYAPWTTIAGYSAGAVTALTTAYSLDDLGIARPPVAAVLDNWGRFEVATGNPFDDPNGSDPVLMVVHRAFDIQVSFTEAIAIETWAVAAGLPLDFQTVGGIGHSVPLFSTVGSTGVTLFQRSVDYQHETIFAGLEQGHQPILPGC